MIELLSVSVLSGCYVNCKKKIHMYTNNVLNSMTLKANSLLDSIHIDTHTHKPFIGVFQLKYSLSSFCLASRTQEKSLC